MVDLLEISNAFVWRPGYETGNEAVDEQHRKIFSLVRLLVEKYNGSDAEFLAASSALNAATIDHFNYEESVILDLFGEGRLLEEHASEHHRYKNYIASNPCVLSSNCNKSNRKALIFFVGLWWLPHLTEKDLVLLKACKAR